MSTCTRARTSKGFAVAWLVQFLDLVASPSAEYLHQAADSTFSNFLRALNGIIEPSVATEGHECKCTACNLQSNLMLQQSNPPAAVINCPLGHRRHFYQKHRHNMRARARSRCDHAIPNSELRFSFSIFSSFSADDSSYRSCYVKCYPSRCLSSCAALEINYSMRFYLRNEICQLSQNIGWKTINCRMTKS